MNAGRKPGILMAHRSVKTVLAGDIGGTKTYLGLFTITSRGLKTVRVERYSNSRFRGFTRILDEFLAGRRLKIGAASFGVASPVDGPRCTLTNLDWTIDAWRISRRYGIKKTALINDLLAASYGISRLVKSDLLTIQRGRKRPGNRAIIAAGTGLGEAMMCWDGARHIPSPSEGGHVDFAPRSPLEWELFEYLKRLHGHVSYERILSGNGLVSLYAFMKMRRGKGGKGGRDKGTGKGRKAGNIAPFIVGEALKGRDRDSKEALTLFSSIYGAEAGNMALKSLALNGVFVGGGMAPEVLKSPSMRKAFLKAFVDKGRFSAFLKGIPVHVILNERTALYGAACHAAGLDF